MPDAIFDDAADRLGQIRHSVPPYGLCIAGMQDPDTVDDGR